LSRLVGANLVLDAACGIGRRAIRLADLGLDVIGADGSAEAIQAARKLAEEERASVPFFHSSWPELPSHLPHRVDGILALPLGEEPSWDRLGPALVGLFHVLHPGGFVMFAGVGEDDSPGAPSMRQEEEWQTEPRERLAWFHREGKTACALLVQKSKAPDYMDERRIYLIDEDGESRLESTVVRRPAYWTWQHWLDASRMVGFCHLETRAWEGVLWKAKDDDACPVAPLRSEEGPYRD
jgi:SAM-dependent methyltransferase